MTKRTNKKSLPDRVEKLMTKQELSQLQDVVIFQESPTEYKLFNKYTITKTPEGEYVVTIDYSNSTYKFNTLKNATTWCIFDKRAKFTDANRIASLDFGLGAINLDIQMHQRLMQNATTTDNQLIYIAKLHEDRVKKSRMLSELSAYANESVFWQTTRFAQKPVY